ncbi:RNA-guided endonuclease InsQ/TnpB family protein, partial [Turicimonas muris]|uniref:RNA-guided endonuclease InsQ/TnpB family protein n=1 Tax=Turicimonas muris TaxID=1796652 RepID=UPI0026EF3E8F
AHRFNYVECANRLVLWKKKHSFLKLCHSQVLQQALKDLEKGYKNFFAKRAKFPRFKKKFQRDSFRFPQGFKIDEDKQRIYLPKIGTVGYRKSRSIIGKPKNITVSREGLKWFVSIQTEFEIEPKRMINSEIGIDMGVKKFVTFSNGTFVEPVNSLKNNLKQLAKLQKKLSRQQKGSSNSKKTKAKITKLHRRIANIRRDFLHKITTTIAKNHGIVFMEDLKVSNMSASASGTVEQPGKKVRQKSGLNRSILDQGWYSFKTMLAYKLEERGGLLVLVPPKNTSRTCPNCGYISAKNRQTQAHFECTKCGYKENADVVGAINVLRAGHARLACEMNGAVRPLSAGTQRDPLQQ